MILDPRYGDSGIRVVRHSRGTEYGHQAYYDRLGHIAVYTHESDRIEETEAQRRSRRNQFFETAGRYLRAGTNLILSPEGTSYWTEDSPGPFRPGAFRLAASLRPEPWIVPIAVANFDRRVHSTACAAIVKPPFKVSSVLPDPHDRDELRRFLNRVREAFASYVEEARRLAARGGTRGAPGRAARPADGRRPPATIVCRMRLCIRGNVFPRGRPWRKEHRGAPSSWRWKSSRGRMRRRASKRWR